MTYHEAVREFKRQYWEKLLRDTQWNVIKAAQIAGIPNRCHVYYLVRRLGVPLRRTTRHGHRGNWGAL